MNLSQMSDSETAHTDPECAMQRAENLAILGARNVLELCVGPSLWTLEAACRPYGISVWGNDIDSRWQQAYPQGKWILGDCMACPWEMFDTVVFAPPLSRGCTGTRDDSLRVNEVRPRYTDFLARPYSGARVMVLPARSISTSDDRREYHALLSMVPTGEYTVSNLSAGRRRIRKYVDVYIRPYSDGAPASPR